MSDPQQDAAQMGVEQEQAQVESPATEDVTTAQPAEVPEELPQEPDKQREAFIKMRQLLKEKEQRTKELEAKLTTPAQDDVSQDADEQNILEMVRGGSKQPRPDPITPDTDVEQVTRRMSEVQRQALDTAEELQRLRREVDDQYLYRELPELDPKHPDHKAVRTKALEKYLAGQYVLHYAQTGKNPDVRSLAKDAKAWMESLTGEQKQVIAQSAATKAVEELKQKEQASLTVTATGPRMPQAANVDGLRQQARMGSMEALAEALKMTVLKE